MVEIMCKKVVCLYNLFITAMMITGIYRLFVKGSFYKLFLGMIVKSIVQKII